MKLDEAVLAECAAQIEEKIKSGMMLATAMNDVLKNHVENMEIEDVLLVHDTVRDMLAAHGYKTGRRTKKNADVLVVGGGKITQPREISFDSSRHHRQDWLSATEDRHEEIHSQFEQNKKGVA